MDEGVEEFLTGQLHAVGDTDVTDTPAGAGEADDLQHRLLGADRLDHRVRADPAGELPQKRGEGLPAPV